MKSTTYYMNYFGDLRIFPETYPLWIMGEDVHQVFERLRFPCTKRCIEDVIKKTAAAERCVVENLYIELAMQLGNLPDILKDCFHEEEVILQMKTIALNYLAMKDVLYGDKMPVSIILDDLTCIETPTVLQTSFEKALLKKNKNVSLDKLVRSITKSIDYCLDSQQNNNSIVKIGCECVLPRFKEYIVKTKEETIDDLIKTFSTCDKTDLKVLYKNSFTGITAYDDETLRNYFESQSDEWEVWCGEVVIFIVLNHILLNKAITYI